MPKSFRILALSLVGLAILLAIIAIGIGKRGASTPATAPAPAETAAQAPRAGMLVATRTLAAGKPVTLSDVRTVPVDSLPAGYFSSPYEAVDALPAREIAADTPLHPGLFLQGLSSHLAAGERAIAVPVDEISGVGNRIEPGDYVDVYLSLPETGARGEGERSPPLARLLASRLRVLSYGQHSVAAGPGGEEAAVPPPVASGTSGNATGVDDERAQAITARSTPAGSSRERNRSASSAVLAVPPDAAGALLLGAQAGKLFLALRNPADTSVADTSRFAEPASVLAMARNVGADPSADDRAYAGVPLAALTGSGSPRAATPRSTTTPAAPRPQQRRRDSGTGGGIQIIRGGDAPRPLTTP